MTTERRQAEEVRPSEDSFEKAWREYNANGNAGGWERVAFLSGFGKGFTAGLDKGKDMGSAAPEKPTFEEARANNSAKTAEYIDRVVRATEKCELHHSAEECRPLPYPSEEPK